MFRKQFSRPIVTSRLLMLFGISLSLSKNNYLPWQHSSFSVYGSMQCSKDTSKQNVAIQPYTRSFNRYKSVWRKNRLYVANKANVHAFLDWNTENIIAILNSVVLVKIVKWNKYFKMMNASIYFFLMKKFKTSRLFRSYFVVILWWITSIGITTTGFREFAIEPIYPQNVEK